ncbi:MAG: heavy-metal-associated domain-containing protein [Beggiatoa sp.]|nr:heavy-metal-associated domain-containing protein [Beggiatoa sp.]
MEKLPGVESAKVSLNEGRAIIQLQPGNKVTMAQIRQSVTRNGFTPQQAAISGEADVIAKGDKLQLRISGTNEVYDLASTPHKDGVLDQLRKSTGQQVVIEGIVPAQKDERAALVIQVNSVKPVTRR